MFKLFRYFKELLSLSRITTNNKSESASTAMFAAQNLYQKRATWGPFPSQDFEL